MSSYLEKIKVLHKVYIILLVVIFINNGCIKKCEKKEIKKRLHELHEICNKPIDELSIVATYNERYYYIKIKNKDILNNFKEIIVNDTFIPRLMSGGFGRYYYFTIKSGNLLYSIRINNAPYDPQIKRKDSADIRFYKNSNFDIYDLYKEYGNSLNSVGGYSTTKYGWGNTCYQFRNYKLDIFLKKYIDEAISKGIENKYKIYITNKKWL